MTSPSASEQRDIAHHAALDARLVAAVKGIRLLEGVDAARERGLGQMLGGGGASEAAVSGQGQGVVELPKFYFHHGCPPG